MAMTYNSLIAALPVYLNRSDTNITAQFDSFILLAQQRMVVDLDKNLGLQVYSTINFVIGTRTYSKPAGWRRNITLSYVNPGNSQVTPIDIRTYEYCTTYAPDTTVRSAPKFYSDYGYDQIYIVPSPDLAYVCTIGTLQLPTVLAAGTQTNWFTTNAPNALLCATIMEGLIYLKDYEQLPEWKEKYMQSIAALQEQNDVRVTDRASDRSSAP